MNKPLRIMGAAALFAGIILIFCGRIFAPEGSDFLRGFLDGAGGTLALAGLIYCVYSLVKKRNPFKFSN